MARDWNNEVETIALLERRIASIAPHNTAPIPIACHKEESERDPGKMIWVVTVHIRIPGVTEYDIEGFGTTLAQATRKAYLGLNNPDRSRRTAHAANLAFGICP